MEEAVERYGTLRRRPMDSGKDSQVWQYKWHILIDLHEGLGDLR
jgi:hypothetical protein